MIWGFCSISTHSYSNALYCSSAPLDVRSHGNNLYIFTWFITRTFFYITVAGRPTSASSSDNLPQLLVILHLAASCASRFHLESFWKDVRSKPTCCMPSLCLNFPAFKRWPHYNPVSNSWSSKWNYPVIVDALEEETPIDLLVQGG